MRVTRLCWVGTQAEDDAGVTRFFRDVMGLPLVHEEPGFAMLQLPGGRHDYLEVFAAGYRSAPMECPRIGFLIDDLSSRFLTAVDRYG